MSEEPVVCKHIERIEEYHNYALGTCTQCGQLRRYDRLDLKQPPKVIKIGRINGVPTLAYPPKEVKNMVQKKTEVDISAQKETVPVRTPRKYKERKTKSASYNEDNKISIIHDYETLTLKEFYAKQHITSTTWTRLKKEWGVKGKHKRKSEQVATKVHKGHPMVALGTCAVEAASELPAFPAFNDSWPMLTQIAWLETYLSLKKLEAKP